MTITAAELLIQTVHEWGVNVILGMPGDGINGIMDALRTRQQEIQFVQVRHEETAVPMRSTPESLACVSRHLGREVFTC
ncbi:MAG: hypothetical protein NPIRA01_01490 [Nitrospirales bacterium]|nr:MAG: hypothetical protein NPIRA01_01490 [Nitrospirales bacterium]